MSYSTLLVHLEAGQSNETVLRIAAEVAERFGAAVIGVAACQPTLAVYNNAYAAADLIAQDRADMEGLLQQAEAAFNMAFPASALNLGWRAMASFAALHAFVAEQARCADLIVTGTIKGRAFQDWTRHANNGALALQAGRPMLIVPDNCETLALKNVLVGWKYTRETRRAVADAVPMLQHAARVHVVEIAADEEEASLRVQDVVGWLQRHRVHADFAVHAARGDDASRLRAIADELGAGLIVAGAYGHSRLEEWAFGGVTRSLLLDAGRCALVSH